MGHPDPKGYYRILNVHPRGTASHIRKSYLRRAKELHPDTNKRLGAAAQFAALNEAYKVLSDPLARARYDTGDLTREGPGAPPADAPATCVRCNRVSAQPRYLIFHQVVGAITHVIHDRIQGIFCPRCARDVALKASLLTWALGWWGLPDGPWASVKAIWRNMRGGEAPPQANARLLAHQALAFDAMGRTDLARALAGRAADLDPEGPAAAAMRDLAQRGGGPVPALKDPWRSLSSAAPMHLAPGILMAVAVVLVNFAGGAGGPAAPLPRGPAAWHVTEDAVPLRDGPGRRFSVVATLDRFQGVALRPVATEDGWVPVWAGEQEGFLPSAVVAPGSGPEALAAWCRQGVGERPETGTVLVQKGHGPHDLTVVNHGGQDAVLKLKEPGGGTVVAVYVRAGAEADVAGLPEGTLQPVYAVGEDWSAPCGTFLTDLSVLTLRRPAEFISRTEGGKLRPADLTLTLGGVDGDDVPADPEVFRTE
jgi:hypothetical protein